MYNANKPDVVDLPSTNQLLKSTGIAAVVASALLVLVVLPAEYGVDPTGAGSLLGLTEMGRIKLQLAEEAKADAAANLAAANGAAPAEASQQSATPTPEMRPESDEATPAVAADQSADGWTDTTTINLAPDEGSEVKLVMEKGAVARFEWSTNGPNVNYDTHADAPGINYHGYGKGNGVDRQAGEITAAFTGAHGWFWRNRSGQPVTITLRTSGQYTEVKQLD